MLLRTNYMQTFLLCLGTCIIAATPGLAAERHIPVIQAPWVQITGNPDLGELNSKSQQPVDFAVWQAADGTWQLWSCIRKTKEVGKTRLLYGWEGKELTAPDWTPQGIKLRADPKLGEEPGGMQAPHVIQHNGEYVMYYGSWFDICVATSPDGKNFTRRLNANGKAPLFRGTEFPHPRDAMLLHTNDQWYCYYTAHSATEDIGKTFCRTSQDLLHWGEEHVIASGGEKAGSGKYSAECPFVVELNPGEYYLFRTQKYGENARTCVYHSNDPLNFGIDNDKEHFICELPIAAPEIVLQNDQYYIVALLPSLNGVQVAPLSWKPATSKHNRSLSQ